MNYSDSSKTSSVSFKHVLGWPYVGRQQRRKSQLQRKSVPLNNSRVRPLFSTQRSKFLSSGRLFTQQKSVSFFNQSHRHINISKQVAKLPHMTSIISSACLRPALRFLFSLSFICFARHRSLSICNTDVLCYRFINRLPIVALTSK